MSDSGYGEPWFVGEDGSLTVKDQVENVLYHPSLNVILVTTRSSTVHVLDVTSGAVFHSSDLSVDAGSTIRCVYLVSQDRVVFTSDYAVGARRDLNGMLLLESALQLPVAKQDDTVCVELPLPDAIHLNQSLLGAELPGVDHVIDVLRLLDKEISAVQEAAKHNHKLAKWSTVCIRMSHSSLKTVFIGLLMELKRLQQKVPALPIVSALLDRLNYLLVSGQSDSSLTMSGGAADRALMYSELARLETFAKWPHLNYKWALPDPMAQAGFYYQPSTPGDDRAMCFTCNVCLVCWEPTDEPWSEHERHSPQCPFVKGEFTQNVPVSVTYATEPAQLHSDRNHKVECLSTSISSKFFATSNSRGNIVVWDTSSQLKKHLTFDVDVQNPMIMSKLGNIGQYASSKSVVEIEAQGEPSEEHTAPSSSQVVVATTSKEASELQVPATKTSLPYRTDFSLAPMVKVTSLSVIVGTPLVQGTSQTGNSVLARTMQDSVDVRPSLVAGIFVDANLPAKDKPSVSSSSVAAWHTDRSKFSEVQALNQLNQAISSELPVQIICSAPVGKPESSSEDASTSSNEGKREVLPRHFVPCLVVYDISGAAQTCSVGRELKTELSTFQGTQIKTEISDSLGAAVQSLYSVKDDLSDDDQDIQIIGVSGPISPSAPKIINLTTTGLTFDTIKGDAFSVIIKPKETEINDVPYRGPTACIGNVIQCIPLPPEVDSDQYVRCIVPVPDSGHVIVVTSPVVTREDMTEYCKESSKSGSHHSCVLVYQVAVESGSAILKSSPVSVLCFQELDDAVMTVTLLPSEVCFRGDEDEEDALSYEAASGCGVEGVSGAVAVTTYSGDIKVLSLTSLSVLATIKATSWEVYVSVTYCSSIDRLCVCTRDGSLRFFIVGPKQRHLDEVDGMHYLTNSLLPASSQPSSLATAAAAVTEQKSNVKQESFLINERLTVEVLTSLHELTQFENLLPRFSATVPPCWSEIQQEQQQRKHPQHLHQQGEATQHTRTWRLQPDSSSWDEHLFELVLPKLLSIGHIDLKFCLNSMCTTVPNIQVTLLKQSVSSIGQTPPSSASKTKLSVDADARIEFNLHESDLVGYSSTAYDPNEGTSLGSKFLDDHRSEIISGPVELANYVDLSGTQGIIPLTSIQLIKSKAKSFMLHIKSRSLKDKSSGIVAQGTNKHSSDSAKTKPGGLSGKTTAGSTPQSASDRLSAGANKQKVENIRGCDWLQEISITVRRFRKASLNRDRMLRCSMLESLDFHERLVMAACGHDDLSTGGSTCKEHRQHLALDLLTWIMAIQINDVNSLQQQGFGLMQTLQANLLALVQSCVLEGDRSIAHKCAKLIALCLEYVKNCTDPDVAPAFNYTLLQVLLDSLPRILISYSTGALHWFFTLLNHVKCMDSCATGEKCIELLGEVSRSYSSRVNPYHSFLRARYGLYGCPLEPDLFDIDPPQVRTAPATNTTYAGVVSCSTVPTTAGISSGGIPVTAGTSGGGGLNTGGVASSIASFSDEVLFKDLMNLCQMDRFLSNSSLGFSSSGRTGTDQQVSRYLTGLLEVEPLHFTCHATSDGTRMERLDALSQTSTVPGNAMNLSGTINFAEGLSSTTGTMFSSLSNAMVSAEQQLVQLQQKQLQLLKLQQQKQKLEQKLAETTKNVASGSSVGLQSQYMPYVSELFPPTPKNTPFFMTPPVTPPNESYHGVFVGTGAGSGGGGSGLAFNNDKDADKPPTGKSNNKAPADKNDTNQQKLAMLWPQTQTLFQPPPAQALVIERMHSGARRFVVLDFGKAILLTDIIIPMCGDLASLSIDTWIEGEEIDGHRLVVSSDIGISSLIMNDIMPPPVCRYLKITTIRRYGGNTTRSKIPIGSFYGHTFILPWEKLSVPSPLTSSLGPDSLVGPPTDNQMSLDQSQILSQLSMYMSLLEDVQCRYSLACKNLITLLSMADMPGSGINNHTPFFLKKGRRTEDDSKIHQAYSECMQLQVQLNLVKHASSRLQKVLGIYNHPSSAFDLSKGNLSFILKQTSVDKLRILIEFLLDTILSMTNSCPTIPQIPMSLSMMLTPAYAEMLFRNLCINGTKKMQTHAGVILVRVCGTQSWWGEFLGNILQEFFTAEQLTIFPQDRVFILLAALGQRSLTGSAASNILENILLLLARQLAPLFIETNETRRSNLRHLDLTLIGWLLLFLSKCLDCCQSNNSDDVDKASGKDKEGRWCFPGSPSNRWNFIQGESAVQANKMSKSNSSKLYRRKLQKRLLHHKQQLMNLQQAKKHFSSKMEESVAAGGLLDKETEHLVKTQDMLFKRQMKQYSSKHMKDIINIRRTDGELLRKQFAKEGGSGSQNGDKDAWGESDADTPMLILSREKCLPVVHGLVTLLLLMDFTCHVDLFIIACKVLARVTVSTRPAISLSEAMKQDELERLMLLMCNVEYNYGNVSWGGSWSGHSITCLLQDILEGERLYSVVSQSDGLVDGEMSTSTPSAAAATAADLDDSLLQNCSLATMDEEQSTNDATGKNAKYDVDMCMLVDSLMEDEVYEEPVNPKYTDLKEFLYSESMKGDWTTKLMNVTMKSNPNSSTIHWGFSGNSVFGDEDKKDLKMWKSKNTNFIRPVNATPQGVSLAVDSRLEQGIELRAELRLKLMLSMEANNIQSAMNAPLPLFCHSTIPKSPAQAPIINADEPEENLIGATSHLEAVSSLAMLSMCFNNLFSQLHLHRINLDVLLQTWLTLNDEMAVEDSGTQSFDPSRIPSVALDPNAVSSLLLALAWSPSVSARTWVLAFQTLTLMANIKYQNEDRMAQGGIAESADTIAQTQEKWLASFIITDNNLMTVLIKFLSGPCQQSTVIPIVQSGHIGPVVVQSFHEFLIRLQLRCGQDEGRLKEALLRLVYNLATEGGAFHLFLGPLDAQCRLIEDLCELNFDMVDVNSAVSIIESITILVHRHIISQERAQCRSTTENSINARSCYVGLFASMIRAGENKTLTGDANHDMLMCGLLKLMSMMVKIPLPQRQIPKKALNIVMIDSDHQSSNVTQGGASLMAGGTGVDSLQTDLSKMSHSLGASGVMMMLTPSAPENGVTDEQKTETARSVTTAAVTSGPIMCLRKIKPCSHYHNSAQTKSDQKTVMVADIVLGNRQIMLHLMEALGCCNTSTIAMILASSGLHGGLKQGSFIGDNPLSVGDGIFHILLTLNSKASKLHLVVKPVYEYLSSELHGFAQSTRVSRLSEPLLWFILRVLDCRDAIQSFLEMGGIEVICQNLVNTNQHVIDTSPSLISAIMQYFGATRPSNSGFRRSAGGTDGADTLQNFAPFGTISSTSPTAGPADVLIHGTTPHRRARSAAWTYHFYPDESWVDLTICLPCAILLKEVNIQPHLTSLATCPAAVTLEGSRDGTNMVPICSPTSTSGLTNIKIQLLREEVVTAVTIRLHKPRDSHTVGLSQITLMGCMAFGDTGAARTANILTPPEDYVSRTSIGWLRLLHHCLTECEELQTDVTQAVVSSSDLLVTCTTLLMTSSAVIYANSIESVLLTIGLHSTEMGLALIDHLLRNTSLTGKEDDRTLSSTYGKLNGRANESTIDILYQLGTNQDAGLMARLKAFTDWLCDCARMALQKSHSVSDNMLHSQRAHYPTCMLLASPAVVHVHCIAAILWYNNDVAITDDIKRIVTKDLLSAMYEWSMTLATDSLLKHAVDRVICSLCYIHPQFFSLLLEWMGIVTLFEGMTDDHKDSQQQQQLGPLTDDLKADSRAARGSDRNGSLPTVMTLDCRPYILQEINHQILDESHLFTLSLACQSPAALQQLLDSGFVTLLCQGLYEVSTKELRQTEEPVTVLMNSSTDALGSGSSARITMPGGKQRILTDHQGNFSFPDVSQPMNVAMTVDTVAPVLRFLAGLSLEAKMKNWLGGPEGRVFWSALLKVLCDCSTYVLVRPSQRVMTNEQLSAIETATIDFFSEVISCHEQNQLQFSLVLHDVIQSYDTGSRGCPSALPGFLRRLFLQVLLEDEKLLVCVNSKSQIFKSGHSIQHPRFGVGHRYRMLIVSLQSTCAEILSEISETRSLTSSQGIEDQDKVVEELKKDVSELGIEVIDQISAMTGLKVKEKREKDMLCSLQRPPSRLGTRSADRVEAPLHIPAMALYHSLLPDQPLPAELNMSQLLSILYQHGIAHGETFISLSLRQSTGTANGVAEANRRTGHPGLETVPEVIQETATTIIPEAVLLQTPNFTSALQVFSSIGGLALLAEHLPLLYPEFSRQATPVESTKDSSVPGIGHDWVTVESAEEIYEEIYEPAIPPSPPVQHKATSIATTQVQSIPPHSLVAFGLFLRLPGYAEVLLKDKRKAQCLLRLVLGVTDDGEGGHILTSPIAQSLPSLPFNVLKSLFDSMPLTTDDGVMLRRMTLDIGAIHLILACLSVLGHHAPRQQIPGFYQDIIKATMQATQSMSSSAHQQKNTSAEEKSQNYWAKGTGFGTGSTTSSWDAEHALLRQKSEEEHVTCLLQVLASYINPGGLVSKSFMNAHTLGDDSDEDRSQIETSPLPPLLQELLSQSCLVPALSSYLRNDSVLDMACHVPLYRALLELLRAMAVCPLLVPLLLPLDRDDESLASVSSLLDKMKQCVDTYASRLKGNKSKVKSSGKSDDDESEGLALLIPDIQQTAHIVSVAVEKISEKQDHDSFDRRGSEPLLIGRMNHSEEERYMSIIKQLQFDTFKMVIDDNNAVQFAVPHHYESNVKAAGDVSNAARARRLAQEAVTLSTSLPLSASSSVFVRCDEERLDVMKVLMTGPSDTPYANGCFEFDVYFPTDYPNSPPLINLETTGNHTVRFNPNLYNDGKVCLSILNTWHGRPEEKWNSQTSSFLQVLVSIQSLILVSEPYFNEPGYERSRGTPSGTASSREYDANIRQATVKWAMLEMLRNPPACFKTVIQWHFWLKKNEILSQVEEWMKDLEAYSSDKRVGRSIAHSSIALKRHYNQLKEELAKLKPPMDATIRETAMMLEEQQTASSSAQVPSEVSADTEQTMTQTNT